MFSPALGRVVRSTNSIATPVCSLGRPATLSAVQQTLSRPPHQRRLSSSKASIPPDGSNANGSSSAQQTTDTSATKAPARKLTGRAGKKRAAPPALNVPHVPPTDYLQKPEVKISSFFSLHRPISVNTPIPPVSTAASFDSIFQSRAPTNRKVMMDNISTLSGGIESLEAALRVHEHKQDPEEVLQSDTDTQHLDGPPQISVDQLMSRFVPFRPPPVPMPLNQTIEIEAISSQQQESAILAAAVKQRAWSTAVVVTESTDSTGKRTYSATTAPMIEISVPAAETSQDLDEIEIRQPFLERMRQRQNTNTRYRETQVRPDMLAISVKRQRKLKMKKHKYKKLMKRTRLLRRKLDRA
ncbi:hypothetical protein K505DRAFT_246898 [Melanomma pulvis-pyrius CBS 109.77]|uniref:Small ribosomal subunit protein mS38 n=1 Tax=Melanomma pulvis-pyrius CBS 109.77 TaxID=1314802 RepID=A0A6A6X7W2_9PLEO|nr:hypothetical protein K505DRAFT_246898 [Melanomma pulvis-pyrius CBS 109.77]